MNHNVKLSLCWSLFENCSASVRSGDVLSALLYLLTRSNTTVGLIQGVNGVLQMVMALPAGYLADRHRRDTMLRAGAAVGAAAGALLVYSLLAAPTVWWLGAAMAMLGCYRGIYSAALEAIFADSIQAGRSSLYTRKYAITVLASSFGPWLSLALFQHLGNRWHVGNCRTVLLWGTALMVLPLALMCWFDDDKALHHQQLPHGPAGAAGGLPTTSCSSGAQGGALAAEYGGGSAAANGEAQAGESDCAQRQVPVAVGAPLAAAASSDSLVRVLDGSQQVEGSCAGGSGGGDEDVQRGCCARLPAGLAVTLLISVSDFIGAFASGMTVRFFAMYFMQSVQLSPVAVSLVGALSPLGVAAASLACQPLSKVVGRVQISIVTRCLDIVLLVCLAYLPTQPASAHRLLVGVHLARMAVANATRPLMRSVLMDFVPRQHRGKVNAVDSVRTFSWSGSAALGGFLIEKFGFQRTFLITAAIKAAAFAPLLPLLAYVPDGVCVPAGARLERLERQQQWRRQRPAAPASRVAGVAARGAEDGLRQPLLNGSTAK